LEETACDVGLSQAVCLEKTACDVCLSQAVFDRLPEMLFYITSGASQAVPESACVEANRTACVELYCSSDIMIRAVGVPPTSFDDANPKYRSIRTLEEWEARHPIYLVHQYFNDQEPCFLMRW
jgi:hypothetical protein